MTWPNPLRRRRPAVAGLQSARLVAVVAVAVLSRFARHGNHDIQCAKSSASRRWGSGVLLRALHCNMLVP